VKKEPKKKTKPKKASSKKKIKKILPPKKRKHKVIKKSSGLPVPKSVIDLTVEMKKKWIAAEKRAKIPRSADDPEQVETVEVVSLRPDDTLERLVENAVEILNETMVSGRPAFEIPSRSGDNIVWDEIRDLLLLGMRTISRPYHSLASVVDATRTARVMEIIFGLLKANLHATKREVFYSDVNLFRDQKYSDKIVEDVSSMLRTTRDSVHVVASARGSAMGRVTIRDGGDLIDLTKMGTGGWAVTPFLDQLEMQTPCRVPCGSVPSATVATWPPLTIRCTSPPAAAACASTATPAARRRHLPCLRPPTASRCGTTRSCRAWHTRSRLGRCSSGRWSGYWTITGAWGSIGFRDRSQRPIRPDGATVSRPWPPSGSSSAASWT